MCSCVTHFLFNRVSAHESKVTCRTWSYFDLWSTVYVCRFACEIVSIVLKTGVQIQRLSCSLSNKWTLKSNDEGSVSLLPTSETIGCCSLVYYQSTVHSSTVARQSGGKMLLSCHKYSPIHLLLWGLWSSNPLNIYWGLTLVWTLIGCLQLAVRPEVGVSLPSLPLPTPPFCCSIRGMSSHHIETQSFLRIRVIVWETQSENVSISRLKQSKGQLCGFNLLTQNVGHQLPSRDLVLCRKLECLPVVETMLIHVNN